MILFTEFIDELGNKQIYKICDDLQWCVPLDPANSDYQAYLKWAEENNG